MNTSYYNNIDSTYVRDTAFPGNELPIEQSYIENILRLNKGKMVKVYMSFNDSVEHRDKEITGIIKAAGRDHIVIEETKTGRWYLLLMIYLDYVEFENQIIYKI